MKKVNVLLFFVFLFINFKAQEIGGIVSKDNGKRIPYVSIVATKDKIVKSTVADFEGVFLIKLPENGVFNIEIIYQGKTILNEDVNVNGNIKKNFSVNEMKEVEIKEVNILKTKKLIERKADRLVFNIENSISAQGGNGLDALRITPGLRVDKDQIKMIGKSGLSVMVNDKLLQLSGDDLINYLKTLTSDEIKSIEVITAPPAKFDAEGNSGIVNIVLKEAKKNSFNVNLSTAYTQSKYSDYNESIAVKYSKNKLSLYTSASHGDGTNFYRTEDSNIFYPDKLYQSKSKMRDKYGDNINLNFGLDYEFSKKLSMGIQYLTNYFYIPDNLDNNITKIFSAKDYLITTESRLFDKKNGNSLNYHSTYKIDSLGKKIDFNLDYFKYDTRKSRFFETNEYEDLTENYLKTYTAADNKSNQKINNVSAKLDFEFPLKWLKLNFGSKISETKNKSIIDFYDWSSGDAIYQPNRSDVFNYQEQQQAVYVSGSKKMGKWDAQLGLRLENTNARGESETLSEVHEDKYLKIFPTVYLLYKPNENNSFSVNYNKRISRPSYRRLNPFVRYINPYSVTQGNPFLLPSFTNNFELNFTHKDNWNTSLYLSKSDDVNEQINYINKDNINNRTKYENAYNELNFGINQSYTFQKWKWLESNNSMSAYYKKIKSLFPEYIDNYNGWSMFFETSNTFILNKEKTISLSLDYWLQLPEYYGPYKMKTMSNLGIGLKTLFLKKQLSISIYGDDLLRTLKVQNTTYFSGIKSTFKNYEDRQSVRIAVKYSFGNSNIKNKTINKSNDEEKNRAN